MTTDERAWHALYEKLTVVLGDGDADTLMARLTAWSDVATKEDLAAVRDDVAAVREDLTAVKDDVAAVKSDLDDVKRDLTALEARMDLRFDALETKILATVRGELNAAITSQTRTVMLGFLTAVLTSAGLTFAAGQIV